MLNSWSFSFILCKMTWRPVNQIFKVLPNGNVLNWCCEPFHAACLSKPNWRRLEEKLHEVRITMHACRIKCCICIFVLQTAWKEPSKLCLHANQQTTLWLPMFTLHWSSCCVGCSQHGGFAATMTIDVHTSTTSGTYRKRTQVNQFIYPFPFTSFVINVRPLIE